MSATATMYPIAHQVQAGGALHRSDLTKILEFWRWSELGGKELKRLADIAEARACQHFSLGTEWGRMMDEVWKLRRIALLDAARVAGQN